MIVPKNIYKKIEKYLYEYNDLKETYEIDEADIVYGIKCGPVDGGRSNKISKSTEDRALKLIEENEKYATEIKWIQVIKKTIDHFKGKEHERIIHLNYIQQIRLTKILQDLALEKSAFYNKKNDVITYATFQALDAGLVTMREIEKGA